MAKNMTFCVNYLETAQAAMQLLLIVCKNNTTLKNVADGGKTLKGKAFLFHVLLTLSDDPSPQAFWFTEGIG